MRFHVGLHTVNRATLEVNPEAVTTAQVAAESWAGLPWSIRMKAVEAFADALEAHLMEFAHIQAREIGLPVSLAYIAYALSSNRIVKMLGLPDKLIEATWERQVVECYTRPSGRVVLTYGKISPALLTGNTPIPKPSPPVPYNVSFTGSYVTAKRVMRSCSENSKRISAEPNGNDPTINIARVALLRPGYLCIAIKRVYVHESVYDAALVGIFEHVMAVNIANDRFDEDVVAGPNSNHPQYERLDVILGDEQPLEGMNAFFVRPIVVVNPPDDARVVVEEVFGPTIPVMKWSGEVDVIQVANNTDYGLGASIRPKDLAQADRIPNKLQPRRI
ncbi:Aldehyde/histidinol dehydrogenase [Xylaria grammica]|nr:Aldehyde/histidinol dehydrogenase [Xylaria grammica]